MRTMFPPGQMMAVGVMNLTAINNAAAGPDVATPLGVGATAHASACSIFSKANNVLGVAAPA